jgi:hypothetical protein
MARIIVAAAGRTGRLVAQLARHRGHEVREFECLDDGGPLIAAIRGTEALVLIPAAATPSATPMPLPCR